MKPDEVLEAWSTILYDVFGRQGCFRQEPITPDEWQKLDERWTALRQMNMKEKKDAMR